MIWWPAWDLPAERPLSTTPRKPSWACYDWDLNAQEAIDVPNFANFNGPSALEEDRFPTDLIETLEAMGHEIDDPCHDQRPSGDSGD
jgi:hypothetical protein